MLSDEEKQFLALAQNKGYLSPRQVKRLLAEFQASRSKSLILFLREKGALPTPWQNELEQRVGFFSLAGYRILKKLGQGGMGGVYLGENKEGRQVAIKVLLGSIQGEKEYVQRFLREAQLLLGLKHPHLVETLDFGVDVEKEMLFLIQEFILGVDVESLLRKRERLSLEEALRITEGVLKALDYAHHHGLIHRDIKPSNILVTKEGCAKLTDFGLVKPQGGDRITRTGSILGTPAYISPEQGQGREVDGRSDLYSLGVTLFHMVTGRVPFEEKSALKMIFHHIHTPFPKVEDFLGEEGRVLDKFLARLVAKEVEERYPSAKDALQALYSHFPHLRRDRDYSLQF